MLVLVFLVIRGPCFQLGRVFCYGPGVLGLRLLKGLQGGGA